MRYKELEDYFEGYVKFADLSKQTIGIDPELKAFVSLAEQDMLRADITLQINGLLISGALISEKTFHERIDDGLRKAKVRKDPSMKSLDVPATEKEPDEGGTDDRKSFAGYLVYCHLENARIIQTGSIFNVWRVKLASIDGWSLGQPG